MNCDRGRELICERMDGEIPDAECTALEAHLAECAGCRATDDAFKLQDADLRRGFAARKEAASRVADRVIGGIRASQPSRRRFPFLWMAAAAAAGFLVAFWVLPRQVDVVPVGPKFAEAGNMLGNLSVSNGSVETFSIADADWAPMPIGHSVTAGTRVRTGPGVQCEFAYVDGSEIRLNEETEVVFKGNRNLQVFAGQVYSNVAADEQLFKVETPQATVNAMGNRFDVDLNGAKVVLTVEDGSNWIQAGPKEEVVRAGEQLVVANGDLGRPGKVDSLEYATRWVHKVLALKGRGDPELNARVGNLWSQSAQPALSLQARNEIMRLADHCVVPLSQYIQSEKTDANRRREAARLLGQVAAEASVPDLIELLKDPDGEVRYQAALALQRITGETQGLQAHDWKAATPEVVEQSQLRWQGWNADR